MSILDTIVTVFTSFNMSVWLAFTSIILLLTNEVIVGFGLLHGLALDKSRLRLVAIVLGVLFLLTIAARAFLLLKHLG